MECLNDCLSCQSDDTAFEGGGNADAQRLQCLGESFRALAVSPGFTDSIGLNQFDFTSFQIICRKLIRLRQHCFCVFVLSQQPQ